MWVLVVGDVCAKPHFGARNPVITDLQPEPAILRDVERVSERRRRGKGTGSSDQLFVGARRTRATLERAGRAAVGRGLLLSARRLETRAAAMLPLSLQFAAQLAREKVGGARCWSNERVPDPRRQSTRHAARWPAVLALGARGAAAAIWRWQHPAGRAGRRRWRDTAGRARQQCCGRWRNAASPARPVPWRGTASAGGGRCVPCRRCGAVRRRCVVGRG